MFAFILRCPHLSPKGGRFRTGGRRFRTGRPGARAYRNDKAHARKFEIVNGRSAL